jgi:hypothetical protein
VIQDVEEAKDHTTLPKNEVSELSNKELQTSVEQPSPKCQQAQTAGQD